MDDVVNRLARELSDAIAAAVAEDSRVEACRERGADPGDHGCVLRPRLVGVEEALSILHLTKKSVAKDLEKLLRSAVANAENREEHVDVGKLYVKEIFVDGGPMLKRIQPAPMGRAFRILKRQSHITIKLDTRKGQ